MKLNIEKRSEILILPIICIILINLIYGAMIATGKVSISYRSSKDGSIQIFYDNQITNAYPFDEEHSITKKLEKTNNEFKTVNMPISLRDSNKIRIDIDGIHEKIEINKIYLSTMGIVVKSISKNDIINKFGIINDGEWDYKNNILTVTSKGDDLFFGSTNIGINLKTIKIVSLLIAILITLLVFKLWKIIGFKLCIKNIKSKILLIIFVSLIMLPSLIYKSAGENLVYSTENRVLKKKPNISINNVINYPKEYEEYYNDNLPFKSLLVRLNSTIKYEVFDTSPAKYVIKGNDGWLFYNSKYKSDGDTLGDYQHTNKYTREELENTKKILVDREKFLKEKGIEMYVFIPPNKSQVYSGFMPAKYKKGEGNSKIEELIGYLRKNTDVEIVNPMEKLMNYKSKYQLYYKLDTHWNSLGAYIGYIELMKNIDKNFKYKDLSELEIVSSQIKSGDLSNMINLNGRVNDIQYSILNFKNDIKTNLVKQNGSSEYRYTSTNLNGRKLLCFRDSFSTSLIPYLTKEFQESVYLWGVPYSKEIIEKEKPNIVIFESVERIANLN